MSCYDWEAGKCNRGESCRFSHGGSGGGGGGRSRRGDDRGDYQRDNRSGNDYREERSRERSRDDRRSYRERSRSRGRGGGGGGREGGGGTKVGKIERLCDKGYGFIGCKGKSIFFHSSGMATQGTFDDLREGDEVEFETAYDDRKGKDRAENVVMLS